MQLGLRTLVIARRELTYDEYLHFDRLLSTAKNLLVNRADEVFDSRDFGYFLILTVHCYVNM